MRDPASYDDIAHPRARADGGDGVAVLVEEGGQRRDGARPQAVVVVEEPDVPAGRGGGAGVARGGDVPLPGTARVGLDVHGSKVLRGQPVARPVGAAVVHDDQLGVVLRAHACDRLAQERQAVERGDDDRDACHEVAMLGAPRA